MLQLRSVHVCVGDMAREGCSVCLLPMPFIIVARPASLLDVQHLLSAEEPNVVGALSALRVEKKTNG